MPKSNSPRPFLFIGSSAEGLPLAKAIQQNLEHACESQIWSQGLFGLSSGTLETLCDKATDFDFAVLALTPDDLTESRGEVRPSPRDNVILELGIFVGVLGRSRVFVVADRAAKPKLPSDLAGVMLAEFQPPDRGSLMSAAGAACTQIEAAMSSLGRHRERDVTVRLVPEVAHATTATTFLVVVENRSGRDLPWMEVNVFDQFRLTFREIGGRRERLASRQMSVHEFVIADADGRLTSRAVELLRLPREKACLVVNQSHGIDGPEIIDFELGGLLFDRAKKCMDSQPRSEWPV